MMSADSSYNKSTSPQSSPEVASLQLNRVKNREALEKGLKCRRSIEELVNQGILPNPSISHPDKVRQLQRAKTSDLLKHKIEKRPDRQYLINRRIIRDDKPGTSPYILERCRNLEKNSLKHSLKSKLSARPGSLELIEKGVLRVDPSVDYLVRGGSIQYPRVKFTSACDSSVNASNSWLTARCKQPSTPTLTSSVIRVPGAGGGGKSKSNPNTRVSTGSSNSRSLKEETVVYRHGSLVFHNYCPKSSQLTSPSLATCSSFHQTQKAREAQQIEMLRLQAAAGIHRLVEKELTSRATVRNEVRHHSIETPLEVPLAQGLSSSLSSPSLTLSTNTVPSPLSSNMHIPTDLATSHFSPCDVSAASPFSSLLSPQISDTPNTPSALEQLSVTKLRVECRERNLTRSGAKAFLIRQLEPYRDEIMAKYFPDPDSMSCDYTPMIIHENDSTEITSPPPPPPAALAASLNTVAPLFSPLPPPVWSTYSTQSSSLTLPSNAPNSSVAYIAPAHPFVISPSPLTSTTPVATPLNSSHTPTFVVQPSSHTALLNVPLRLRHTNSAPFMTEGITHATTKHLLSVQGPARSAASTALLSIPTVQTTTDPSAVLFTQPPPTDCSTTQTTVYLVSNLLPVTPATDFVYPPTTLVHTPFVNHTTSAIEQAVAPMTVVQSLFASNAFVPNANTQTPHNSSFIIPASVGHSGDVVADCCHDSMISVVSDASYTSSSSTTNQPSSLNQIEDLWLQIRQLRRQMAKERVSESPNSIDPEEWEQVRWNHLQSLREEHDRLAILCRLLAIDRLDALDNLVDSGVGSSSSSESPVQSTYSPTSQLQLERNVLLSYLQKLGGTALVNRVASPSSRTRRSSSPLLHTQLHHPQTNDFFSDDPMNGPAGHPGNCQSTFSPTTTTTSTSCIPPNADMPPAKTALVATVAPRTYLTSSWSEGLHKGLRSSSVSDCFLPNSHKTVHRYDANESRSSEVSEPQEPPASPSTTDALFELWNSLLRDATPPDSEGATPCARGVFSDHPNFALNDRLTHSDNTGMKCRPETGHEYLASSAHVSQTNSVSTDQSTVPQQPAQFGQNGDSAGICPIPCYVSRDMLMLSRSLCDSQSTPVNDLKHDHRIPLTTTSVTMFYVNTAPLNSATGDQYQRPLFSARDSLPRSHVPAAQLADALFTSLHAVDFVQPMDTTE